MITFVGVKVKNRTFIGRYSVLKNRVWKTVVIVVMLLLAPISVSFNVTERAYASEPVTTMPSNQETEMVYTVPVKKNVILTETVTIPEVDLTELTVYELEPQMTEAWKEFRQKMAEAGVDVPAEMTLEWIKEHLYLFYTDDEVLYTTLIVQGEDLIAQSETIWSAHVWVILGRVGAPGFGANSIIEVLSKPGQFATWCAKCLSEEPNPEVEEIVRDVFARKILEDLGFSEREVGRTVPATHLFFDNRDGDLYNEFYRFCWGDQYDPFSAPYNPYST